MGGCVGSCVVVWMYMSLGGICRLDVWMDVLLVVGCLDGCFVRWVVFEWMYVCMCQ